MNSYKAKVKEDFFYFKLWMISFSWWAKLKRVSLNEVICFICFYDWISISRIRIFLCGNETIMNKQEIKFCLVDLIRKAKKIISKQEIPDFNKRKGK